MVYGTTILYQSLVFWPEITWRIWKEAKEYLLFTTALALNNTAKVECSSTMPTFWYYRKPQRWGLSFFIRQKLCKTVWEPRLHFGRMNAGIISATVHLEGSIEYVNRKPYRKRLLRLWCALFLVAGVRFTKGAACQVLLPGCSGNFVPMTTMI